MIIKTTFALFLTMYLFPLAKLEILHLDSFFIIQLLSEIVFGMIAGLMLQIVFAIVMMAGEQIAFTMGFTMASVLDPSSNKYAYYFSNFAFDCFIIFSCF